MKSSAKPLVLHMLSRAQPGATLDQIYPVHSTLCLTFVSGSLKALSLSLLPWVLLLLCLWALVQCVCVPAVLTVYILPESYFFSQNV